MEEATTSLVLETGADTVTDAAVDYVLDDADVDVISADEEGAHADVDVDRCAVNLYCYSVTVWYGFSPCCK